MLSTHTNAQAVPGRPTLEDVEREFRNRSFGELQKHCQETSKETQRNAKHTETKYAKNT